MNHIRYLYPNHEAPQQKFGSPTLITAPPLLPLTQAPPNNLRKLNSNTAVIRCVVVGRGYFFREVCYASE